MSYNRFKNNTNIIKKKVYSFNINEYPDLNSESKSDSYLSNIPNSSNPNLTNFQDAILKPIEIKEDSNVLEPGCVYIKRLPNNKIIYEYGPQTDKCKLEKYQEEMDNNVNNIMNNIITKINMNRERYRMEYNTINGINAYEDFYEKYYIKMDDDSDFENVQDENFEKEDEYF
jgi:hypothetical protein